MSNLFDTIDKKHWMQTQALSVPFKKLLAGAVIPTKSHDVDAGFDLTAVNFTKTPNMITYHTGISVSIPKGYMGLLCPRSSIYKYNMVLANSPGIIDAGYQGEILVKYRIILDYPGQVVEIPEPRDRIAQLLILKLPDIEFVETKEFAQTADNGVVRGTKGFGSTGK